MAEDDPQRGTAKRQIARLIGNASVPIYVLGEGDQLLYANDALASLLRIPVDELIGLDCSSTVPKQDSALALLAARLSLPPNGNRSQAQLFPISIPPEQSPFLVIAFPLEDGPVPMTFCSIKQDFGDRESIRGSDVRSNLHRVLSLIPNDGSLSSDLWFLFGTSPTIARTRAQLHAACQSRLGVHVTGSGSSANLAVAKWIVHQRGRSNKDPGSSRDPLSERDTLLVIECRLMDRDLMRGMLELATEPSRRFKKDQTAPSVILHQIDLLTGELIEPLCNWYRSTKASWIATSSAVDLLALRPSHQEWGEIVAHIDSHSVHVPALTERTSDIEAIVAAWLELFAPSTKQGKIKVRWTQPFIDAMLAYSWPGDVQELEEALRFALEQCPDYVLTDRHLPVPLRTFPSHVLRPEPLPKLDLDAVLEQFERDLLEQALSHFPRNRTAAANHLGISRARLLRRLQQLGLDSKAKSADGDSDTPVFEDWKDEES